MFVCIRTMLPRYFLNFIQFQNHLRNAQHKKNCGFINRQCRCISGTPYQKRGNRIFWEQSRKGEYAQEDKTTTYENVKMGFFELKTEIKKWRQEMVETFEADPIFVRPGDTDVVFDFKTQDDLNRWIVTSDQDFKEGYSHGSLVLSPVGRGLFSGEIDLRVPKDGKVKRSGYCNMTCMLPRKSFKREIYLDWTPYSHLFMRVRGDGRRYLIVLNTSGEFDMSWHDRYIYVLYTRGGPYWQTVKIPFSKFLLTCKGRVQDKQFPVPRNRIRNLGITCSDRIPNTFRLEIDSIGLHCDISHTEEFAYELYKVPPYIVS